MKLPTLFVCVDAAEILESFLPSKIWYEKCNLTFVVPLKKNLFHFFISCLLYSTGNWKLAHATEPL